MEEFRTLQIRQEGSLARLFLNRPDARNAMNQLMIDELYRYFDGIKDDRSVRVVVISGRGSAFCAGGDLKEMRAAKQLTRDERVIQARHLDGTLNAINEAPQVVIAEVNGVALGGGVGLICVADIALAADDAMIGLPEVRLGIVPSVISPYVVGRIGLARARHFMLTGARMRGADAIAAGFVSGVEPAGSLSSAVNSICNDVLKASPSALAACKLLLRTVADKPTHETAAFRVDLLSRLQSSDEGQEGMSAFIEKRPPSWLEQIE